MSDVAPAMASKPDLFDLLVAQELSGRESGLRPSAASDIDAVMPLPASDRVSNDPAALDTYAPGAGRAVIAAPADEERLYPPPPIAPSPEHAPPHSVQTKEIDQARQHAPPTASAARANNGRSVSQPSSARPQLAAAATETPGALEATAPATDFVSREAPRSDAPRRNDRHRTQPVERTVEVSGDAPSFGPSASTAVSLANQVRPRTDAMNRLPSALSPRMPQQPEPTIEIHIGRLEVRAESKAEAHRPARKSDDSAERLTHYLRRRSTGARS